MSDDWRIEGEHVMTRFRRWEREAKKENRDTIANILREQEEKEK